MPHEAYIWNAKCWRRIEKSNNHMARYANLTENVFFEKKSKILESTEHINASFSISKHIDFWSRKNHIIEIFFSKIWKRVFTETWKMTKFENFRKFENQADAQLQASRFQMLSVSGQDKFISLKNNAQKHENLFSHKIWKIVKIWNVSDFFNRLKI